MAGIIGIGLAIVLPNVILALSIFYFLDVCIHYNSLLFGLFTKRSSASAAIISTIVGIIVTVGLDLFNGNKGYLDFKCSIWLLLC